MEEENRLDEIELEKAKKKNIDNDVKDNNRFDDDSEEMPVPIKDTVGHWTDKQIAENPLAYIKYLEGRLKSATARQDLEEIKSLISEISEIENKYFSNTDNIEKGRSR